MNRNLVRIIAMLLLFLSAVPVLADDGDVLVTRHAQSTVGQDEDSVDAAVDWGRRVVEVTAGASADPRRAVNAAHLYSMATRAARALAYERLAEAVQGVTLDASATYRDELLRDSRLRTETKALIRGAEVVGEEMMQAADGSPWVEVTLALPLDGGDGLTGAVAEWSERSRGAATAPVEATATEARSAAAPGYTGLIVDLGGFGARPAMMPRISTANGVELYGPGKVTRDYLVQQGLAGYAKSLEQARRVSRVGIRPLIVRAGGVDGDNRTDAVVSAADAGRILAADAAAGFLAQCRVVFIVN